MESIEFLNYEFLDNSLRDYFYFIVAFIFGAILIIPVKAFISKVLIKLSGKESDGDDIEKYNSLLKKPLQYFLLLIVLYFSVNFLNLPDFMISKEGSGVNFEEYLTKTYNLFLLVTVFWVVSKFIDFVGYKLKNKALKTESKVDDQLIPFAIDIAKVLTIVLGFVMILGNVFNVNVTALVTGLGIGGVAFALASKESLENLLGSFTIFFDKPFTVGDIVTLGGVTGIVEKVGFRSTRIRTFDKSLVTLPNKKMIDAELDNLGMRPVRRVKFNVGLTYETSSDQIKAIVSDIQEMINKHPKTNQSGKVRFQEFGSSSLDIMVMYYVNSPRWDDLIDVKEDINYKIMEIIKKHKSDFAFPSTTVYLQK